MHDPANELYDDACGLLAAAQELHRAAARGGGDEALAPTLGCLQATLHELAAGCGDLRAAGSDAALDELAEALLRAEHASEAARAAAARRHATRA